MARTAFAAETGEDARFNAFLDAAFDERLALSPEFQTGLGMKTNYDKLDDYTDAGAAKALALSEGQLARMKAQFGSAKLNPASRLSWRLFEEGVNDDRAGAKWRRHGYLATSNGSPAGQIAVFLINQHRVDNADDARAYVARLVEVKRALGEVADELKARAAKGVVAPDFTFAPVDADTRKLIAGAPFDGGPDGAVWADFQKKVNALKVGDDVKAGLIADGKAALTGPFKQGVETFLAAQAEVRPQSKGANGVWALPDGAAYYTWRLKDSTSTDLTADQIHQTGLDELKRIQGEMRAIMAQVGFKGSLQDFFKLLKTDPKFQYPNTAEGKAAYLKDATGYIAQVMKVAPRWFGRLPKAPLEVRAVESWREATAGIAFYNAPTPDGSRPGIYYVNLSDMRQVLKPQIEGISYHEGAPGHHFQIALAQELEGLPKFRKFGFYGAYTEGWGLYSERLGKEMGFYQDPYSDFGRLSTEAWRAVRLVTDTGLHAKRWTKQQAMDFFRENTLLSERDIQKEVERYLCWPGQATSYKVGELKIMGLRKKAQDALGAKFDIRGFHDVILHNGALPLGVLEEQVDAWIAKTKG
ncbi:DUF885 domain-containing protein [Caulobacter mirabilis]|uniref:DUF885 domain-containing protein n=2 Tax=Caulobacter mirabilis TaxID=69666 RepID=A0A2D2B4E8_9CAUL|nr:DUF885 domain-containing protein [Caulobacter mirabilis]